MSGYRVLPIHPDFQGPSGEPHQINVNGVVKKVTLFHGKSDEELDWHIYLSLSPEVARRIGQFLRQNGETITDDDVAKLYCELMVTDAYERRAITWPPWQGSFQRKYDSADLSRVLRLVKSGSNHPAYDLGREVADEPGNNKNLSDSSRLYTDGGRVYMQGLLVLDVAHSPGRLEIHPPDSVAFALDDASRTLAATQEDDDWPDQVVRWRVAWFTNSAHHRITDAAPLKQQRTTTWYLPLPGRVKDTPFPDQHPLAQGQTDITTEPIQLWNSKNEEWYDARGVSTIEEAIVDVDPHDNRRKLRVSATMNAPSKRGGLVVRDYVVRFRQDVNAPIVNEGSA